MPIPLKPLDAVIGPKWKNRATAAAPDYAAGVSAPLRDWATNAAAAAPAWKAGVTDAAGRNAFEKGVKRAGTAKWQAKAKELGSRRYPEGVAAAEAGLNHTMRHYLRLICLLEAHVETQGTMRELRQLATH
jgi:hypothetical protein